MIHPAFASLGPYTSLLTNADAVPSLQALNAARLADGPAFIADQPDTLAYELRIARDHAIPTRPGNWHDAMNALCWLAWPNTKGAIHQAHRRLIESGGERELKQRSPARDVLTLFDEAGVVVLCSDPSWIAAWRDQRWVELFVDRRAQYGTEVVVLVLGHALLERALTPDPTMTGKVLALALGSPPGALDGDAQRALADREVAAYFDGAADLGRGRDYGSLPLAGLPGWDTRGAEPAFYLAQPEIFRPCNPLRAHAVRGLWPVGLARG